jgi:DNA-binding PadR family transcriptional regulator
MSELPQESFVLWDVAVLALLRERPMHPYEIQRVLKERHKDDVLVLKRGSLYHAIERLQDAQLIEALETTRDGRRPERTTYRITAAGQCSLGEWLRRSIATPRQERSEFLGSISFLVHLTPQEALAGLEARIGLLQSQIAQMDAAITRLRPRIGRINLVESEYARAMRAAELQWVRAVVDDLRSGAFTWNLEEILDAAVPK